MSKVLVSKHGRKIYQGFMTYRGKSITSIMMEYMERGEKKKIIIAGGNTRKCKPWKDDEQIKEGFIRKIKNLSTVTLSDDNIDKIFHRDKYKVSAEETNDKLLSMNKNILPILEARKIKFQGRGFSIPTLPQLLRIYAERELIDRCDILTQAGKGHTGWQSIVFALSDLTNPGGTWNLSANRAVWSCNIMKNNVTTMNNNSFGYYQKGDLAAIVAVLEI